MYISVDYIHTICYNQYNVDNDLKGINQQKCNGRFDNFLKLHNLEVERLTGYKNLSSIAI